MFASIAILILSIALIGLAVFAGIFGIIASAITVIIVWVIAAINK